MNSVLRNPDTALQSILRGGLAVLGLAATWLLVTVVWVPEIDSMRPPQALLEYPPVVSSQDDKASVTATYDFVDRPLFLTGRRPVIVAEGSGEPELEQQATEVVSLDGFALLGVFSSQGVGGVMLKSDDGDSLRLYVGEELQGMTLAGVESRSALFEAPARSGRPDVRLAMELGSIPMPAGGISTVAVEDDAEPDQPKSNPLTFEAMDAASRDRSNEAAQRRRERDQAWRERVVENLGKSTASVAQGRGSGDDEDKGVKSGAMEK